MIISFFSNNRSEVVLNKICQKERKVFSFFLAKLEGEKENAMLQL